MPPVNTHTMMSRKTIFTHLLLCLLIVSTGCARSVTEKDTLLSIEITITFRGPINLQTTGYYIIFGSSSPQVPTVPPADYFPTPGRDYNEANNILQTRPNGITHYYETYFSTWSDYIILHNGTALFQSGGSSFPNNISTKQQHLGFLSKSVFNPNVSTNTNTIVISFLLQELSITPSRLFFTVVTADLNNTESGEVQDILQGLNPSILTQFRSELSTQVDAEDLSISGAADITGISARIF